MIPIIIFVIIARRIRAASRRWTPRRTVVSTGTPADNTAYIITTRHTTYQRVPTFDPDAPPPYTPRETESCPPPFREQPPSQEPSLSQEQSPSQEQLLPQEPPPAYEPPVPTDGYSPAPQTFETADHAVYNCTHSDS